MSFDSLDAKAMLDALNRLRRDDDGAARGARSRRKPAKKRAATAKRGRGKHERVAVEEEEADEEDWE